LFKFFLFHNSPHSSNYLNVSYGGFIPNQSDIAASEKHRARARRALEKKKKRLNILEESLK